MSIEEIEAEALMVSDQETARLWAEEADRRDADLDAAPETARPAATVLRDARARLK